MLKEKTKILLYIYIFTSWKAYSYQGLDPQKTKTLPTHKIYPCPQNGVHVAKHPVLVKLGCFLTLWLSGFQTCKQGSEKPALLCPGLTLSCGCRKNSLHSTTWWEGSAPCSSREDCQVLWYELAGIRPGSLSCESGLWECRLWDQNCIKDYFGLRMSLISQVLTVACRLEDLKFPIISHTNQEEKAFWKAHVKN